MSLRDRLADLLLGDPPTYPPGLRDGWTVSLVGLRVPTLATGFVLLTCALLLYDRNYDVLPRFGPLDPTSLWHQAIERAVVFGLVPLAILLALREDPRRYGLGLGDVRRAAILGGASILVTVPVIVLVARIPEVQAWYAPSMSTVPQVVATFTLDLVATEFLLRGLLLFALLRVVGPFGVVVAAVPFVMAHIGKPDLEAFSTLGGGLVFGWLVWRTGAIWASAAYHVAIQVAVVLAAAAWAGGAAA